MVEATEQKKEKQLKDAVEQGAVAAAYVKLDKKYVDVEVSERLTTIEDLQKLIENVEESDIPKDKKGEQVGLLHKELKDVQKNIIQATLMPLNSMEILMVQAYVAEASLLATNSSFELDVRLFMIAKAELCSLVYYALRQRDNHKKRYFPTPEDTISCDQASLNQIAKLYKENFVLTAEERKNS